MGREENVLIFQDTERLSKTNGKLNADLKASASGQKLILETDALEKPNLNIYDEPAKVIVSKKRTFEAAKHIEIIRWQYTILPLLQIREEVL